MLRTDSITENKIFRRLYYKGHVLRSPLVVLYYMKNKSLGKRNLLGLTVSTKVGKAVRRNKVRRWMREAYRAYEPKLCCGYYIVLVARICAVDGDYSGISKVIGGMFKRAGLFE